MSTVDSATLLIEGPWRHRFVAANGARFHVTVSGPDDRDTPLVVLLHGVPQFWWAWRRQIPALADAGYRVAAMDVRGTGSSDKPPQGYDVPTLAADVAGVVRSLGASRAIVVGNGTGGEIAWAMAALQPDVVQAVAALGAPHPLDVHGHPRTALRAGAWRRLAFAQLPSFPERALQRGDLVRTLLTEWGGAPGWLDAETEQRYREAVRVPFAAHSQMEQLRWLVRSMPRLDGRRYHAALEQTRPLPVLQVHGGRDGLRPATYAPLSASTKALVAERYRYELVPSAGHWLPDEAPDVVSEVLLDWLSETALVSP
ncbi:alpha/beta fold hydrolase [Cellulomonas septica]|uniref:Alpha/beta hydrolase n=1 Tax=Cellulomonas septica TaxID=285080 RepID=A0ABX1K689_9CELL|nr:alpha/beta hydrolase [Cellulomonas septica]NKY40533.1 alpha/beta hydrolase [Cellulomonas septica]